VGVLTVSAFIYRETPRAFSPIVALLLLAHVMMMVRRRRSGGRAAPGPSITDNLGEVALPVPVRCQRQ
jgi:hypothetical protein